MNQRDDGTWDLESKLDEGSHEQLRALWNVSALRQNAALLGIDQGKAERAPFWSYEEYEAHVAEAAQKPAEDPDAQTPDPNAGTGSTPIPAAIGAQQATGTGLGAQGDEVPGDFTSPRAFADESLASKQYEDWSKDQLIAEVAKRNEMREGDEDYADEEPMSTSGNKSELAQRLTEDDEADGPA